ncbi:MAG TPA: ribonuclease P protein component [Amnibacterium sp.]|nr:ribonuclease P protein component [Amnibacterium sp.]
MLAKANRVTSATDYRRLVRSGRRSRGSFTLAYGRRTVPGDPLRVGVIVARNVGGAVVRNRVRRRIKAAAWPLAAEVSGLDVVVRALPAAATASWPDLAGEVRGHVTDLAEMVHR